MVGAILLQKGGKDMAYRVPEIDGQKIACPSASGVDIKRNQVHSSNFRRTSTAKAKGTVVDNKVSIKMSFPPNITVAELKLIKSKTCDKTAFHKLGFTNEFGEWETITVYFNIYSLQQYGFINGKMLNQSISFEAVEQ